eukprot:15244851-Ditylum_brightwellii.AAC.1
MENILAYRQIYWLGKIVLMEESRLLWKFISAWHINPCPTGCPQQTIRHTYLRALCMMGAILKDDKEEKLADWFPQATEDPKEWERHQRLLTPNLIGRKEQMEGKMRENSVDADLRI